MQTLLATLCGAAVGFSLGLIGGGGSILAVPLLMYVVGVSDPHVAIGTSALSVGANALGNFLGHWRHGHVRWAQAATFALFGVAGAALGSSLGKLIDGRKLLILFALAMFAVAFAMLRPRRDRGAIAPPFTVAIAARLAGLGLATGAASGFFGIGGGFLIVPALMFGGGLSILDAVGSSLLSVGAFGLTTAANYAWSGMIEWRVALEFLAGGVLGGAAGIAVATRLGTGGRGLTRIFAAVLFAVAIYMIARTLDSTS
ncbi:MAG: sulfite exporter TauE/SafE family protein [Gammaproteobacteria bacterium]|nr:sulfite exporter TauE/SafE family protein [Gammaproteobacteria bacterium]